jgi:hypothetical protein
MIIFTPTDRSAEKYFSGGPMFRLTVRNGDYSRFGTLDLVLAYNLQHGKESVAGIFLQHY